MSMFFVVVVVVFFCYCFVWFFGGGVIRFKSIIGDMIFQMFLLCYDHRTLLHGDDGRISQEPCV